MGKKTKYEAEAQRLGAEVVDKSFEDEGVGGKVKTWDGDEKGYLPQLVDLSKVGKLPVLSLQEEATQRAVETVGDANDLIRKYSWSINPITGRSRVVTVMMKLEEMALKGNIMAAREFLDRSVGRIPEVSMNLTVNKYEGMSDEELLKKVAAVGEKMNAKEEVKHVPLSVVKEVKEVVKKIETKPKTDGWDSFTQKG